MPSPSVPGSSASPQAVGGTAPWSWQPPQASLAVWPVSVLALKGADTLRFLHGQSSQAIALAQPGQVLATCCISPTARMQALAEVLVDTNGAWLVISAGDGAAVRAALDRVLFPADAVSLAELRPGLFCEAIPADRSQPVAAAPPLAWRPLAKGSGFWVGSHLLLLDTLQPPTDSRDLEPAAQTLLQRPRLSAAEQEHWRLQQGRPAWPDEVNDGTNPFELGLAARVSLNKGCYVGQETLAKLATYDGVKQQLRRWSVPGAVGPKPGASLSWAGERAGTVTSALALPDGNGWIGLALVRRQALAAPVLLTTGADEGAEPLALQLSLPEAFVAPPVGAGGAASTAQR